MSRGVLSRIMASPKYPNPNTGMLFYAGRGIRVAHRLTVDLEMGHYLGLSRSDQYNQVLISERRRQENESVMQYKEDLTRKGPLWLSSKEPN